MRARHGVVLLCLCAIAALPALVSPSSAAENFLCGPGGRPDPKTARCVCGPGKFERTTGGTSRCVEAPAKPKGAPSATTSAPTTTTMTTSSPTTTPPLTCAPSQFPTARGCVERCAPSEIYREHLCVPRCRADEAWNGQTCVRTAPPPGEAVHCEDGRVLDATGHCCFAGQTWGEQSGRCRGVPRCPAGLEAEGETCAVSCEEGMQRAGDGVHCCWPGQEWSGATRECIGVASCPDGFALGPDGCEALRICEPGKVAIDAETCCWPGQHVSLRGDEARCAGAPTCPAPMIARDEECFPPGELKERDERADRSETWGARSLTLGLGYAYALGHDHTKIHALAIAGAWHPAAIPIRVGVGVQFGNYSNDTLGCWDPTVTCPTDAATGRATTFVADVSFAPFSMPNLAREPSSYLNPFVGLELRAYSFSNDDVARSTPATGQSLGLVLGDALFFKPFALTVAYSLGLVGVDSRPSSAIAITLGYATDTGDR